jgi:arabinogalactan endo-1,4-beta-galactosidase
MMRRISIFLFFIFLIGNACEEAALRQKPDGLSIRAADVSFIPSLRAAGTSFKTREGNPREILSILQDAGANTIRLRIWHTPKNNASGLEEVAQFSKELKQKGFKVWLTVHYSDDWADPGKQTKPAAWNELSTQALTDSVAFYTKRIMQRIQPDYIQIGNEINEGFLWPEGNITNRSTFLALLKAGIEAVRTTNSATKIMIHYAGVYEAYDFFSLLNSATVDYDIVALSYYPWWHGSDLAVVKSKLVETSAHNKDIVIAETAYPFTLGWSDWTHNIMGLENQLVSGYPATEQGQLDFLMKVRSLVAETPRGIGFAYWAPEWVAYKGTQATDGSSWENLCLFDFSFTALPAMRVFSED